jgi:hypothetical protein
MLACGNSGGDPIWRVMVTCPVIETWVPCSVCCAAPCTCGEWCEADSYEPSDADISQSSRRSSSYAPGGGSLISGERAWRPGRPRRWDPYTPPCRGSSAAPR